MNTVAGKPVPVLRSRRGEDAPAPLATALRVTRNLLWSCFGSVLFVACLGFFGTSLVLVSVLREIGRKDFTEPMERINAYKALFEAMRAGGAAVEADKPNLHDGVTTYLWTVKLPESDDLTVFRWQHDLNLNIITAMSGPAVMADLTLGYIPRHAAEENILYDKGDELARRAILLGLGQRPAKAKPAADGAPATNDSADPPLPPLISPDDAKHRGGGPKEEETPENPCAAAGGPEDTSPGDHTEANPPKEGGADGGGGEPGGGNSPGGGGLDEPPSGGAGSGGDDGAVPVH